MQVCANSKIKRSDITYVEAHGTGTVVGDAQELSAIDAMYGTGAGRTSEEPLLVGSVKSNMGHCEGCSGLAGEGPTMQIPRMGQSQRTAILTRTDRSLSHAKKQPQNHVRASARNILARQMPILFQGCQDAL